MHIDIDYARTEISNTGGSEVRPNITISVVGLTLDGAFWFHGWTIRMQLIHLKSHFLSSIDSGWMTLQAWTKAYCGICSFLGFNMNSSVNCWSNAFYTLSILFSIFFLCFLKVQFVFTLLMIALFIANLKLNIHCSQLRRFLWYFVLVLKFCYLYHLSFGYDFRLWGGDYAKLKFCITWGSNNRNFNTSVFCVDGWLSLYDFVEVP